MQAFPSEESLKRPVGAVTCEQDEIWSGSRYFAYDKTQELYDGKPRKPKEGPERPAAELAEEAKGMILASLALADRVEAA